MTVLQPTPADDSSNDLSTATGITAALDSEPGISLFCMISLLLYKVTMFFFSCRLIN